MKKTMFIPVAIASLAILQACSSDDGVRQNADQAVISIPAVDEFVADGDEKAALAAINEASIDFFRNSAAGYERIFKGDRSQNFAISPVSIVMAMGMMSNAADGDLSARICDALHCDDQHALNALCNKIMKYLPAARDNSAMSLANSVWYQAGGALKSDFINDMRDTYYADVLPLDFAGSACRDIISRWVSDKTQGMIPSLDISAPKAELLLVNAMYFNSLWDFNFDKSDTRAASFAGTQGSSTVDMMHQRGPATYLSAQGYEAVAKSLHQYDCILILPREGVSLADLSRSISYKDLTAACDAPRHMLELDLPRFELSTSAQIEELLAASGVSDLTVDLSNIGIHRDASVSMMHRTAAKVDEKGIKAAAVSAVIYDTASPHLYPEAQVAFDRPFMYFVLERTTGCIILAGQVCNL